MRRVGLGVGRRVTFPTGFLVCGCGLRVGLANGLLVGLVMGRRDGLLEGSYDGGIEGVDSGTFNVLASLVSCVDTIIPAFPPWSHTRKGQQLLSVSGKDV